MYIQFLWIRISHYFWIFRFVWREGIHEHSITAALMIVNPRFIRMHLFLSIISMIIWLKFHINTIKNICNCWYSGAFFEEMLTMHEGTTLCSCSYLPYTWPKVCGHKLLPQRLRQLYSRLLYAIELQFLFTGSKSPNLFLLDNAHVHKDRSIKAWLVKLECPVQSPDLNLSKHI